MRLPSTFVVTFLLGLAPQCFATVPACLPENEAGKVKAAQSVEERLLIYAEIGERQAATAHERAVWYRPWPEHGHAGLGQLSAVPTLDDILRLHDCAWKELLLELERWCSKASASKSDLVQTSAKLTQAHHRLRLARIAADWTPELHSVIESSLTLLARVQRRIDRLIVADIPMSARLPSPSAQPE